MATTRRMLAAVAATAMLGACAQDGGPTPGARVGAGALAGAALGAGAGLLAGGSDRRNALVGAGIGAIAGAAAGAFLNQQEAALNRDLAGTGATVVNTGGALVVTLPDSVTFATGSSRVQPQFLDALDAMAGTLAANPQSYVDVIGHTDSTGSAAYNQRLSEARADAVARVLVDGGVQPARIATSGFGLTQPIADNATPQGRAANRRVEIRVTPFT